MIRGLALVWAAAAGLALAALPGATQIGGLGHVVPAGGVIQLTGPPGAVVDSVFAARGMSVRAGDRLVSFGGREALEAAVGLAEIDMRRADAEVERSAALHEIALALRRNEVERAVAGLARVEEAGGESFSPQKLEQEQDALFVARRELERARLQAEQARDARRLEQARARHALARARADLAAAFLRAPVDATLLEVGARPGERAGGQPLVRLADLTEMHVVCDVFESELGGVSVGMGARVSSSSLAGELSGEVVAVGGSVDRRSQMGKVRIRLDDPLPVAGLVHMQVDVKIGGSP